MGKGKPGQSKAPAPSKPAVLQGKQAVPVKTPATAPEKKRKPTETEDVPTPKKMNKASVAAPPPEPESDSVDDSNDIDEGGSGSGEEFDGSEGEFDDDDNDSVDSDTSGTISEDLDLNKPNDSDDDESSGDSDDSDEDDEDGDKTVTVDFEFKDPQQIDFLSLRNLLSRYLPASDATAASGGDEEKDEEEAGKDEPEADAGDEAVDRSKAAPKRAKKPISALVKSFNPSEIADAIIEQVEIGTTVKAGDDPDVYAFVTALNLSQYKNIPALRVITDYLVRKCPKRKRAQFRSILQNKKTALMLNERMMNMPVELAPNLHQCFVDDLDWAVKQPGGEGKFDLKQVVLMCPRFQLTSATKAKSAPSTLAATTKEADDDTSSSEDDAPAETGGDIAVTDSAAAPSGEDSKLHFYKWEEALLHEAATFEFTFGAGITSQIEGSAPQHRTVIALGINKYREIVKRMHAKLAEAIAEEAAAKAAAMP